MASSKALGSREYAESQDQQDPLRHFRELFIIPTKADLAAKNLKQESSSKDSQADEESIYLCGNSLGLQPRLAQKYFQQYLDTWATKGVFGHFRRIADSNLAPWLDVDEDVQEDMARIVGAKTSEVAVMQSLTVNLHLLMASFFKPTKERYKIMLEGKAFPSDHYAVESHLRHHNLSPSTSMILIEPPHSSSSSSPLLPTSHILSTLTAHASSTALLLLPGIQFYTGQLLDIAAITAHARSLGITVGWDLAHAAGNVPLALHAWDVDFAAWCSYKYLNAGPGAIGGCFVHERHFARPERLQGWWGASKARRFAMDTKVDFEPSPGALGFQVSNTSVADTTAVRASLDVFKRTSMETLREKSVRLTGYLVEMLDLLAVEQQEEEGGGGGGGACFSIITPRDEAERGAQISVLLSPGMLEEVMRLLEAGGVVVDERQPDAVRVAPAPLYNSFVDVYRFIQEFREACRRTKRGGGKGGVKGD